MSTVLPLRLTTGLESCGRSTAGAAASTGAPGSGSARFGPRGSQDMPSHPGQISFPGGKVEECDATPLACALREAHEEIGLPPGYVEPLGYLDSYRTGTGFQITPVVAFVRPGFAPSLDSREVLEMFEVPLGFLMDEANHQKDIARVARAASAPSTPCPTRAATSGAPLPACSRTCTRGCFSDDPRRHREHPAVPAAGSACTSATCC